MIRITSQKEGFRRCGVAHSKKPTEYPDDRFTKEELAALDAEPLLFVEVVESRPDDADPGKQLGPAGMQPAADSGGLLAESEGDIEDMTVAEIKELLDKLAVEYDPKAKKADLVQLVKDNTGPPPEE